MKPSRLLVFSLILPLFLCGCSGPKQHRKHLPLSLHDFNEAVVWKHYSLAGTFAPPAVQNVLIQHLRKHSEGLHLVEVEPLSTKLDADGERALCKIRFSWYTDRDPTVRKGLERQEWVKSDGRWWLVAQKPPEENGETLSPFVNGESAE